MPYPTRPRETYQKDMANVRRLREALDQDQTADPKMKAALLRACDMLFAGLGMLNDVDVGRPIVEQHARKIIAQFESAEVKSE